VSLESRRSEPQIPVYSRGFRGLWHWLLLKAGMSLLLRGSAPWRNRSVYIVDGSRAVVSFMLEGRDAVNTIMALPSIWLSLETSGDRAKRRSAGSGYVSEANGTLPIQFTSESSGKGLEAVSKYWLS